MAIPSKSRNAAKAAGKTTDTEVSPGAAPAVRTRSKATAPDALSAGADMRRRMLEGLGTLKEDPKTIVRNDFQERSYPSGNIVLDEVLGVREYPCHGSMLHVHGEEHSGKSTLLYCLAGAYQRYTGRPVMIHDIEGQLRTNYLWQCGLNPDTSFTQIRQISDPNELLRVTVEALENGWIDYFVFDSIAHIMPEGDLKAIRAGKALNLKVGDQARLFKKFLYTMKPFARRNDASINFVNQQSAIIPQTTKDQLAMKYASITRWDHSVAGGKAARYGSDLMLQTAKMKAFEGAGTDEEFLFPSADGKAGVGRSWDVNKTEIRVLKNKINNGGYRQYHIYIRPGGGIDGWISVRELALHYGLIKKVTKDFAGGGSGYIVGAEAAPLMHFKSKGAAVEELVLKQNMDLLEPLHAMLVDVIRGDDPRKFVFERSKKDAFVAGDIDRAELDLEEEIELGVDDEVD